MDPRAEPSPLPLPLRALEALGRACNATARLLVVALGAVMALVILLQVFLRYVLQASLPWSEELARYLMVWIGLLGASLALHEGRHVGVTFLVERLPGLPRRLLAGLALLAVLGFLGLLCAEGTRLLLNIWQQRSPAMNLPMVVPYAAIPLGALFMLVQALRSLARLWLGGPVAGEG